MNTIHVTSALLLHLDKQPPKIEFCPRKIRKLVGSDGKRKVKWNKPKFTDNSGLDLVITKSHESGSLFELGRHLVTYVAKDSSGNEVTCRFSIIIVGKLAFDTEYVYHVLFSFSMRTLQLPSKWVPRLQGDSSWQSSL